MKSIYAGIALTFCAFSAFAGELPPLNVGSDYHIKIKDEKGVCPPDALAWRQVKIIGYSERGDLLGVQRAGDKEKTIIWIVPTVICDVQQLLKKN